jgi:hypothetical protein
MPLGEHANNDPGVWIHETDLLGYYIKVYMMADKYNFPSVRLAVVEILRAHFVNHGPVRSAYQSLRSKMPDLPEQIAYVCGTQDLPPLKHFPPNTLPTLRRLIATPLSSSLIPRLQGPIPKQIYLI